MTEIVEFIKAQLAIDEQFALRTFEGLGSWAEPRWVSRAGDVAFASFDDADKCVAARAFPSEPLAPIAADIAAHIARYDPATVLADVAAKRAIAEDCAKAYETARRFHGDDEFSYAPHARLALRTLRRLAAPYAERPGFKPKWALT